MFKNANKKFTERVMKIIRKILPRFSYHYVVYTVLFFVAVFSVVTIVTATTPNPGHPWTEVGDGFITFANPGSAVTYTGPTTSATLLTTANLVTVGQGGIGIGTLASNGVLYGNGTGAVQALAVNAGASQCLTQASSAAPVWAACGTGTVTNTGGSLTANSVVLGAGTNDTKVVAGITTNGTAQLILGVNTTTLGTIKMFGNTSGDVTLQPTAAAGTATTQTLPATSGTLVNRVTTGNGVSASNTDGALSFTLGAITPTTVNGNTFTTGSSTYTGTAAQTYTFPTTTATIARTDAANTFAGTQTFSGLIQANLGVTLAANQNLTMTSGTGVFAQTYSNVSAGSAETKSITNTNGTAGAVIVNGYDITQVNGTNASNTNTNNGINFNAATNTNSNTINGINFASATGYTNFLKTPTFVLSSAGAVTGATGIVSSGTIQFSTLTTNGALYTSGGNGTLTTTAPTSGAIGYWSRTGTVLSPTTANDTTSIANTTTTGADVAITNTGVYTGTGVWNLTANSATTGTLASITGNALTTGSALIIPHTTSVIANGGSLVRISSTSVDTSTTTGVLLDLSSTASTAGTQFLQTYSGLTTGIGQSIIANNLTSGTALNVNTNALTSGAAVNISSISTGAASSTQKLLNLDLSGANSNVNQSTFGAWISNTHTNGTSGTNYGLYARASSGGGTTVNSYAGFFEAGDTSSNTFALTAKAGVAQNNSPAKTVFQVLDNGAVAIAAFNTDGTVLTNNTSSYTGNLLALSATGATTGRAVNITMGSTLTTGGALTVTGGTYTHTAAETGSLVNLAYTDNSSAAFATTTNGILITPTINSSAANARTFNAISVAPVLTACGTTAGTCTMNNFAQTTPALTQTTTNTFNINGINLSAAGALVQNTAAGVINWTGENIQMPNITQTTGTVTSVGLKIAGGTVTSGTSYALTTDATAGNVGIGTTTPGVNLHIFNYDSGATHAVADTGDLLWIQERLGGTAGERAGIRFSVGGGGGGGPTNHASARIVAVDNAAFGADIAFETRDVASIGIGTIEHMRIQAITGNVGIGTTAPSGNLAVSQTAAATGILKGIVYTGAVNTNQTLSTEIPSLTLTTAGRQWATGALTTQREVLITQPTYSFVGASTITNAATVGIAGAPIASTNATLTNSHGLLIQAGAVGAGTTNSYGITVNAQTGATNNYAAQFMGGNVGIGDASPVGLFTVGASDAFQVSNTGVITTSNLATGGASQCLQANTSGVISLTGSACGSGGGASWDAITNPAGNQSLTFGTNVSTWTSTATTQTFLTVTANSLTTGKIISANSSSLTSGAMIDIGITGTAALTNQKGINVSLSGANGTGTQTTYGGYFSNTHSGTTPNNVGLYATASGGTNNYAGIFESGRVLIGTASETASLSNLYMTRALVNETGSTGAGVAGIHEDFTMNPTSGTPVQVGNRMTISNTTGSVASTQVGQIIRMTDSTASLANTIRGIEVVASVGTNTSGTNTGIRATGATFGVQGITTGTAGGVSAPAALYGENQGTTQGDALRLYSTTVTSAPQMAYIYQDTSTFTGTGLMMDMGVSNATFFTGDFVNFKKNGTSEFKVTNAGVVSMGLAATASTNAVCSTLANATGPTAGTAYTIVDCNAAPAADYAENYPVVQGTEYGDIVATGTEMINTYGETNGNVDWTKLKGQITRLVKTDAAYQKNVIGIVADNHGDFTSAGHNIKDIDNPMPVALNGRVPVKIATDSDPIMPGDYITTSATEPGKAMKATHGGMVIGKALAVWAPGSNTPTVMVYVEQGYYDGQNVSQFAGIDPVATDFARLVLQKFMNATAAENTGHELVVDRLAAGIEIITTRVTTDKLATNTITASTGNDVGLILGADGKFTVRSTTDSATAPAITFDSNGNATFKGTVNAKNINLSDLSGIASITDQINQLSEGQVAFNLTSSVINTLSGALTIAQSDIIKLTGDIALINTRVDGLTTSQTDIDNRLHIVEGLLAANAFNSLNSVNTLSLTVTGDTMFNGLTQFSGASSFNSAVTFANQVEFSVPPLFNKDTAGFALVKTGDKRVHILFNTPYITTPVVNTSITFDNSDNITDVDASNLFADNVNFVVLGKDATGFTIMLNKKAPRDIRFSWVALSVKDPQIYESAIEGLTIDPTPTPGPSPEPTSSPTPTPDSSGPSLEPTGSPTPDPAPAV